MSFQQWSSKSSLMVLLPSRKRRGRGPPPTPIRLSLAGPRADVHFDLRSQLNEAIRRAAPPQQAGEDPRAHTHKALSLARRDDSGSSRRPHRALATQPAEVAAV